MSRWKLRDTVTGESWQMPMNPREMAPIHPPRGTSAFPRSPIGGAVRAVRPGSKKPYMWNFSGGIRDKDHYQTLLAWTERTNLIELTDHLGRTLLIRFVGFDEKEKRPGQSSWRFDYAIQALIYGRTS